MNTEMYFERHKGFSILDFGFWIEDWRTAGYELRVAGYERRERKISNPES
jgi:hypothetical protein